MLGYLLILFGALVFGYTLYSVVTRTPATVMGWISSAFYLVGGAIIFYYGYQMEYPPQPTFLGMAGGRRWYK